MKKLDNVFYGILFGILAAAIGFIGFGLWWTRKYSWDLVYFFEEIFLSMNVMQIGTFSILTQMLVFYIFYNKKMNYAARGVLFSTIVVLIFLVLRSV